MARQSVVWALLFLLVIAYPLVAIPATGAGQAVLLFVGWGVAIAVAAWQSSRRKPVGDEERYRSASAAGAAEQGGREG